MKLFVALALLFVLAHPAIADRPHNIFDDDWTPPKTAQTPRPPATIKPVTPPPADPTTVLPKETTSITPSPARLPIPTTTAQAAVRKVMKDVYAEQLADRAIPARRKLTKALLTQADKSKDAPVDQFVLLAAAIDSAIDAANLTAAFRAADKMSESFDVDGLGIKADAALRFGPKSAVPDAAAENVSVAIELANNLARVDDFTTAARVCAALQPATAGNPTLRTQLQQCQRDVSVARDSTEHFTRDQAKLKASPEDPAANLAVGRYLCFIKNDWPTGLPLLSKATDPLLKSSALLELSNPTTVEEITHLADTWWDASSKQPEPAAKAGLTAHAAALYAPIVDKITGLRRVQIEKRIADASKVVIAGKLIYTFEDKNSLSDFDVVGNATLIPGGGVELSKGTPSVATTKAVFGLPIRVEFEAYCMPSGILDMSPRICAQSDGSGNTKTGFALLEGNDFNARTTVVFFGKSSELPHSRLKANEVHKIVLSVDSQRHAQAQFDGETVFEGDLPAGAKAEGHVMVNAGRGDVVYKRVVIVGQPVPK